MVWKTSQRKRVEEKNCGMDKYLARKLVGECT